MQYVYVLQSKVDEHIYIGCTSDLKKRISLHNSGKVKSTCKRIPLELVYYEAYRHKDDAYQREKFFKTGWGRRYVKKILPRSLAMHS